MCAYLLGEQFKGPYRGAYIEPPYMNVSRKGNKKRELCESSPNRRPNFQLTYEHSSKDSQFLEVCKKPILTDLPVLIKTESKLGRDAFPLKLSRLGLLDFLPIRSLH